MGFKNSSAYFQREIDAALKGLRLTCCVVYIDDVCVYSSGSFQDHLQKVRAVLRALRAVGFSGNPQKCKFAQKEVEFLGHRVANGKIYALEDKIKAMLDYTKPETLTRVAWFPWSHVVLSQVYSGLCTHRISPYRFAQTTDTWKDKS